MQNCGNFFSRNHLPKLNVISNVRTTWAVGKKSFKISDKDNRKYNIWWPQNIKCFSNNCRVKCFEWLKEKRVLWDLGTNCLQGRCRETTTAKTWKEADFGVEFPKESQMNSKHKNLQWKAAQTKKWHLLSQHICLPSAYLRDKLFYLFKLFPILLGKQYFYYSFRSTGLRVAMLSVDAVPCCVQLN